MPTCWRCCSTSAAGVSPHPQSFAYAVGGGLLCPHPQPLSHIVGEGCRGARRCVLMRVPPSLALWERGAGVRAKKRAPLHTANSSDVPLSGKTPYRRLPNGDHLRFCMRCCSLVICFISLRISNSWFTSALTSSSLTPLPLAMRTLRL